MLLVGTTEIVRGEYIMLAACWIALGLFQTQADPVKGVEIAQAIASAQAVEQARDDRQRTDEERHRFEEKFNRLVSALEAFQREYNASGGQVWPAKKAEALKKAIRELPLH